VARNGGIIIGAYDSGPGEAKEPKLIGFSYAFPARDQNRTWLYSHMTGFLEPYRGQNLGFRLKCFQRQVALERKYDLITWTYDPLFAGNGRLNIGKLGGIARQYERDYYGRLGDPLNAGLPTDRCIVEWYIGSNRVERVLAGKIGPGLTEDIHRIPFVLSVSFSASCGECLPVPEKTILSASDRKLVLPFPRDFQWIKTKDNQLALSWRLATREILLTYFSKGYALSGAWIGENLAYYVLEKDETLWDSERQ